MKSYGLKNDMRRWLKRLQNNNNVFLLYFKIGHLAPVFDY